MEKRELRRHVFVTTFTIIIGFIILISAIYVMAKTRNTLKPDYAPGIIDKNAVPLPNDGKKAQASDGGGSVSLSYSNKVSVNLKTNELTLYFQNPSKSTHNMVLEVIITQQDRDIVIAKSEMLPVGYAIYKLDLSSKVKLVEGGYNGKFNILYYDEETEEKAVLNTNIPITIVVE